MGGMPDGRAVPVLKMIFDSGDSLLHQVVIRILKILDPVKVHVIAVVSGEAEYGKGISHLVKGLGHNDQSLFFPGYGGPFRAPAHIDEKGHGDVPSLFLRKAVVFFVGRKPHPAVYQVIHEGIQINFIPVVLPL
jgi:hypothetical protein